MSLGDIRMKLIANQLIRMSKQVQYDADKGMSAEGIRVKYAEVLSSLDEIERIHQSRPRLIRIK